MEEHFAGIIEAIGENINREGLIDTPKRAAKAFKFLNNGYDKTLDEVLNNAIFTADTEDMVIVKDIELYSLCEHHLLPFIGKCHVGYLPQGKVLGLSKVARIGLVEDCPCRRYVCAAFANPGKTNQTNSGCY